MEPSIDSSGNMRADSGIGGIGGSYGPGGSGGEGGTTSPLGWIVDLFYELSGMTPGRFTAANVYWSLQTWKLNFVAGRLSGDLEGHHTGSVGRTITDYWRGISPAGGGGPYRPDIGGSEDFFERGLREALEKMRRSDAPTLNGQQAQALNKLGANQRRVIGYFGGQRTGSQYSFASNRKTVIRAASYNVVHNTSPGPNGLILLGTVIRHAPERKRWAVFDALCLERARLKNWRFYDNGSWRYQSKKAAPDVTRHWNACAHAYDYAKQLAQQRK